MLPDEKYTCSKCKKSSLYSKTYINAGLAVCASRICRNSIHDGAVNLVNFLGYKFIKTEATGNQGKIKVLFVCNNKHETCISFEFLRRGSICKICTRLNTDRAKITGKDTSLAVPRKSCNCASLGFTYGTGNKLCEHYNLGVLCERAVERWSANNIISVYEVSPKSNLTYLLICPDCKKEYSCRGAEIFAGAGCSYCIGNHKISVERSFGHKHPELLSEWSPENTVSPFEIFAGSDKVVSWICAKGHKWQTKLYNRTASNTGCLVCNGAGLTAEMGAHEQFLEESIEIHHNKYQYPDKYVSSKQKIRINCPKHGDFFQLPLDHRRGHGCYHCGMGKRITAPVRLIISIIEDFGFECNTEVGFPGLKNINVLAVDIFIPELNLAIEYDGAQHFKPIASWGGQECLVKTQQRDLCKDVYMILNKISFLRIPYTYDGIRLEKTVIDAITNAKIKIYYASYQHYIKQCLHLLENKSLDVVSVPI